MHDQRSCTSPSTGTPAHQDRLIQGAVLTHVVTLHPAPVTVGELIQEIATGVEEFPARDAIERAVRDLAGVGLLYRHDFLRRPDALVLPSRAALTAHELWLGDEE
ncbi:MAG: hypothetical protein WD404_02045 [Solirubrobacterales bacterium]